MKPIVINYSRRTEFIKMLKERKVEYGAEIGTDHGQYAQQLFEGIPGLNLACVDPWIAYVEGDQFHTQEEMDEMFNQVRQKLAPYSCKIVRMNSMEAVRWIVDETLDFVFIDGNHDFKHCYEDIVEWTRKVKPGGIVAGHDYKEDKANNYGVVEAVTKYVAENNIAPLFIMHKGGALADCWMFIKQ